MNAMDKWTDGKEKSGNRGDVIYLCFHSFLTLHKSHLLVLPTQIKDAGIYTCLGTKIIIYPKWYIITVVLDKLMFS